MGQTSANTESTICLVCTGTTATSVSPPHPVYGGLTGGTVVELNMIALGGFNGLNN
jgi:hypothetical protein